MNLLYLGEGEKLFGRMISHGPNLSQKIHELLSFYPKVKAMYPGQEIICLGYKLNNLTHARELFDYERAVLSFIKALRPDDTSFTNVEFPNVSSVIMKKTSQQAFGFDIFSKFMMGDPDHIRHFIIYKGK